ncbi:16S rRNA (guanine(527)-N(7))-methyltransferase RsmG [Brevundimonas intermedia]|uniref:16S rRNA (guanine(527)-N(7))-methyltransferase RsmG n=1 Tax=Brevundimonas intermedia TaxID=74315 RepID=UPI00320B3D4C
MLETEKAAFQVKAGATPQQMADLEAFRVRLGDANSVMNLVGPDSLPDFWNRHVWDSAQLLTHAPEARTWADLGAGAGFPGVVLAILMKGWEGAHVWLIDSLGKRCRFLQEIVDSLDLPATVIIGRAEEQEVTCDIVTARAVAPMDKLLGYAQPYFQRGAQGLFLKGERAESELIEARKSWHFEAELAPSQSDVRGRIVTIRSLRRARTKR